MKIGATGWPEIKEDWERGWGYRNGEREEKIKKRKKERKEKENENWKILGESQVEDRGTIRDQERRGGGRRTTNPLGDHPIAPLTEPFITKNERKW